MADILREEDLLKMKEAVDKAADSVTPFPIVKDGNVAVAGDPNKTELNSHNFEIDFRLPDMKGGYETHTVKYNDVFLSPRRAMTAQRLMTSLMPLFRKVKPGGEVSDYDEDEQREIVTMMDENVVDLMYSLVASVLGIKKDLVEYMTPKSVLESTLKIFNDYPELVNAGDAFFGY